ncbi:hypothetical protein P4H66_10775 [Paenibacillus dokdonensis]|uniref:Lipoprotein n=1 Tax=Paenibacillus dokdonensis TaxID=2567944 RepID=A0ABU6GKU7_9BACL|nr:hypothetical protein [Paenibacillus dokdonensis]MEC0240333.1 hypothetical protein [Paenibacillus dokdonensis]
MKKHIFRKVITALLSSVSFCAILDALWFISHAAKRDHHGFSFSFTDLLFIYLIYATPVYLVVGVTISMLLDWWREQRMQKHHGNSKSPFIAVFMYAAAGAILHDLYLLYVTNGYMYGTTLMQNTYGLFGAVAAMLYWAVDRLLAIAFQDETHN